MRNAVFIFGAGASVCCGAPVMKNFLDHADKLQFADIGKDKVEVIQFVLERISRLQRVHSKARLDLVNIESVFNAVEMGLIIGTMPGIDDSKEITVLSSYLKKLIAYTLEEKIIYPMIPTESRKFVHGGPTPLKSMLEGIFGKNGEKPLVKPSFITFNYDLALDLALTERRMQIDYGFGKNGGVQLSKLHGSLNWALVEGKVTPCLMSDFFRLFGYNEFSNSSPAPRPFKISQDFQKNIGQVLNVEPGTIEENPVIVPPAWNKSSYHSQVASVWRQAAKALSEADAIFVFGYSMPETDSFFKLLYALGTASDKMLKGLYVFDVEPEGGVVDQRFRALLGPGAEQRYRYFQIPFEESAQRVRELLLAL